MENSMAAPQKIKNRTTMWFSSPTSEYIPKRIKSRVSKRYMYTHIHSSIMHKSQKWEQPVSINRWMDRTSLVAQWLRIRLPMQGTQVRALVWEDPTGRGAAKPVYHNYWACALQPVSHNYWAHMPQLLKPVCLEPVLCNKRSHRNEKPMHHSKGSPRSPQLEKARVQQWRPNAAKNK